MLYYIRQDVNTSYHLSPVYSGFFILLNTIYPLLNVTFLLWFFFFDLDQVCPDI